MASQALNDFMQSGIRIKFYFVTLSGTADDASEDLKYSFQIIAEFLSSTDHLQWISEDDCILLPAPLLSEERNIFVLDEFEGQAFDHVQKTKAIVLGPKCVLRCQLSNDVVPNIASPIYTLAMKNVVVCISGISPEKRSEIHKLVGFMGGLWLKELTESTTHLITNTTQSPKYEKSAVRNIRIMKEEWIYEVWRLSKIDDTSYTTDEFYDKYKLPIFHNLVVTSTGISEAARIEMVKLIENNGGTYSGSFKSRVTDILISQPNQRNSDKFKAAVKCRKECLMVDWVMDSASKGYALPYVNYRIYTGQPTSSKFLNSTQLSNTSTRQSDFNPEVSSIANDVSIAETISNRTPIKSQREKCLGYTYKEALDKTDISIVKTAEGCLDGCTIWLCGFDALYTDKLKKIINIGGAIRIDEYGPNVEYVIVGKPSKSELSNLKSLENPNILTVHWLIASINSKKIADPKDFIYKLETSNSDSSQTVPSPASRKNIEAMNPFRRPGAVTRKLNMNDVEDNVEIRNEKTLLEQYANPSTSQTHNNREDIESETTEYTNMVDPDLLKHLTFALFGFSEESTNDLRSEIEEAGGIVVEEDDFSKTVSYLIITRDIYNLDDVRYKAEEIVTELWIQECLTNNRLADIEYYHRAILLKKDTRPLEGLHFVFSTYTSSEREYYYWLTQALGGNVNDRYVRAERPILICPTPEGKKYLGAIKWNLPVVSCEWLKKCYELEEKVPLRKYLIGEAKCMEDEENAIDQNSGSNLNIHSSVRDKEAHTQKFEKNTKKGENQENEPSTTSNNRDLIDDVPEVIPERNIDVNKTPSVQHPRVSSIRQGGSRQLSPQSPNTTPRLYLDHNVTPLTRFTEDLTPETKKLVYDMMKPGEEADTPLTKRRKVANASNSPVDMSCLEKPDFLEMLDRNYVEMPKEPKSASFLEYRKEMYRKMLGDKYDGTPLRRPPADDNEAEPKTKEPSRDVEPTTTDNEHQVIEVETTQKESTQVQAFRKSIQRHREDYREPLPDTEEIIIRHSGTDNVQDEEDQPIQPSQPIEVDWRDPDEFNRSDRFLDGSHNTFKGKRCFSMSLTVDSDPQLMKDQIIKLGGTVCDSSAFDPSCTHLICAKPNPSEKTMSIVASGRWLLCPSYIADSFKEGRFLNEEEYEWGNPKAKSNLSILNDSKADNIAKISHKRRIELQLRSKQENRPVGIFSGFRVILHSMRKDSFKRLLEAGCGVVVELKEPYSEQENFPGVTHCFIDKRMNLSPKEKAALSKAGVHCVTILYLQACLTEESMPNVDAYLVK